MLKDINHTFVTLSENHNYDIGRNKIFMMNLLSIRKYSKLKVISVLDQNSNMPFLRNEVSEIFEDLFTMTLLKIKAEEPRLTLVIFWIFFAVKC